MTGEELDRGSSGRAKGAELPLDEAQGLSAFEEDGEAVAQGLGLTDAAGDGEGDETLTEEAFGSLGDAPDFGQGLGYFIEGLRESTTGEAALAGGGLHPVEEVEQDGRGGDGVRKAFVEGSLASVDAQSKAVEQDVFLRFEVLVDGHLRRAGVRGNAVHADVPEAVEQEELGGCLKDQPGSIFASA